MQKKLGEMLVDAGVLNLEQLQEALEGQRESGKRLGEMVVEMQMCTEDEVQNVLADQLGIEKIDLYEDRVDPSGADDQRRHDQPAPSDARAPGRQQRDRRDGRPAKPAGDRRHPPLHRPRCGATHHQPHALKFAYDQLFGVTAEAESTWRSSARNRSRKVTSSTDSLVDKATMAEIEQAPIVKLVDTILTGAVDHRASDVHLEPKEDHAVVRYRVDGMLHKILTIPRHAVSAVTARLKIMARCDTSERRKPQDGRIDLNIRDMLFDIRFSTVPTIFGEKIVMRLLNKSARSTSSSTSVSTRRKWASSTT